MEFDPLIIVADDNLRPDDLKRRHGSVEPLFPESQPQDLPAEIAEMGER